MTKIVVGKTAQPGWRRFFLGTVVDQLLEKSGAIDIYVIRGEFESLRRGPSAPPATVPTDWTHYTIAALVVASCTFFGWLNHVLGLAEANIIMVYLLGVAFVASRQGRGPAIAASVAGVLFFDFFFVPPYFTLTVNDPQYYVAFAVMLAIGLLISTLTARLKEQLTASQKQEHRTADLYRFTKQLSEITGVEFLIRAAGHQLRQMFRAEVLIYLRETNGSIILRLGKKRRSPKSRLTPSWPTGSPSMTIAPAPAPIPCPTPRPFLCRLSARSVPWAPWGFGPRMCSFFSTRSSAASWKRAVA